MSTKDEDFEMNMKTKNGYGSMEENMSSHPVKETRRSRVSFVAEDLSELISDDTHKSDATLDATHKSDATLRSDSKASDSVAPIDRRSHFREMSRRSSMSKSVSEMYATSRDLMGAKVTDPGALGPNLCSMIVVNYISAGYILLPNAFAMAGLLYSTFLFGAVALQSYITAIFMLETCARAESLQHVNSVGNLPRRYSMAIRSTKFELSSLEHMFLGTTWANFFLWTTACDLYSISWTLCTIFASALSDRISIGTAAEGTDSGYRIFVAVFMAITVPLSCTSILDQAFLQFVFLGGRMLMLVIMVSTIVVAFVNGETPYFGDQVGAIQDVPLFDVRETITIIQTAIFATAFQFSVPAIASVSENKKAMKGIFKKAVSFVYGSNVLIALLMGIYFGTSTESSSNLNWSSYNSRSEGWERFVSGYVVFFAAIDGLAVFPLICASLGDILLSGYFGESWQEKEKNWKIRIMFRLLASVPQTIGALFLSDLGFLAKYGGVFTLLSYSAAPAILYIVSGRKMEEEGLGKGTYYSSPVFSSPVIAYALLGCVGCIVVGVILDGIIR